MRVLCRNPDLNYYQGYHDIAVTLLRVTGEDLASILLEQLSLSHLRDFMDKNMTRTMRMLNFFYAILAKVDTELSAFLDAAEVGTIFALSWLITWFGHDINKFDIIVRLCDLFLAFHPLMPVYFAVVVVHTHREKVLEQECELPFVHGCLQRLPTYIDEDDIEPLIARAHELYQQHPPESMKAVARESYTFLKESDSIAQHNTLITQSFNQRPDNVLRRRKKLGRFLNTELLDSCSAANNGAMVVKTTDDAAALLKTEVNPIVKVAVWTMTLSMGVMTFLVLNTSKYWT